MIIQRQSSGFIPTYFTELKLWLDSANPLNNGTQPADSASITTWTDVSGVSGNFISSGNPPTYKRNIKNGLPGVQFDGTNDSLSLADTSQLDLTSLGFTIFVVAQARIDKNAIALVKRDAGGSFGWQLGLIMPAGATYGQQLANNNTGGLPGAAAYSNTPFSAGSTYAFTWQCTSNEVKEWRNEVSVYSVTGADYRPTDIASSDIYLGSYRGSSNFFDGYIFEVLVFTPLTSAQRLIVLEYLRRKWNVY